jgi:hypothetical protein
LMTARDGNHGTIVPDADATEAGMPFCSLHAKPADERFLRQGHAAIIYNRAGPGL